MTRDFGDRDPRDTYSYIRRQRALIGVEIGIGVPSVPDEVSGSRRLALRCDYRGDGAMYINHEGRGL